MADEETPTPRSPRRPAQSDQETEEATPAVLPGSFASRDMILGLDDRAYEVVEVPEWNGALVRVRGLTGRERDSWEASMMREDPRGKRLRSDFSDLRAKLIVRSVVDGEGNRIFTDADVAAVSAKSSSALQRIFEVCQRLSRLTDQDVDELTGNSSGEGNAENGSASPITSAVP